MVTVHLFLDVCVCVRNIFLLVVEENNLQFIYLENVCLFMHVRVVECYIMVYVRLVYYPVPAYHSMPKLFFPCPELIQFLN